MGQCWTCSSVVIAKESHWNVHGVFLSKTLHSARKKTKKDIQDNSNLSTINCIEIFIIMIFIFKCGFIFGTINKQLEPLDNVICEWYEGEVYSPNCS